MPDKPAAWLMTTAKHRALDRLRHVKLSGDKLEQLGHELDAREAMIVPDFVERLDDDRARARDRRRRAATMFCACHPVLSLEARVALTLKMVAGLTTGEIARAYPAVGADGGAAAGPREAHAGRRAGAVRAAARRRR